MAEPTVIKDPIYSFEIARRAVGRAALHLGVDSMTEQALDVMADVLLQYLSRTGRALSHLAESSRRPSAHVNVLDAFQACQLVTAPAVGRLHLQGEEEDDLMATNAAAKPAEGDASPNGKTNATPAGSPTPTNGGMAPGTNGAAAASSAHSATSWKGLAAFCFGPNWLHEKDEDDYLQELAAKNAANASNGEAARELSSAGGGKVFPTSLENDDDEEGGNAGVGDRGTRRRKTGWEAPFPDEIPAFPKASSTCANPHALPARVTGGLTSSSSTTNSVAYRKVDVDAAEAEEDEQETLDELEALSDGVFLPSAEEQTLSAAGDVGWGRIDGKRKRTREDGDGDVEMEAVASSSPQTKKIKFQDGTKAGSEAGNTKTAGAKTSPAPDQEDFTYIPSFYPKPPSTKVLVDDRRTVVDAMDDRQERLLQQQRTQEQQEQQVFASNHDLDATASTTALRDGMNLDSNRGIRSSLIRLGNHSSYWGSGWDKASSSSAQTLAVPMGRKVGGPSAQGGKTTPDDPIIPMSRASGSRVSRVLEGSMDAAAMQ